MGEYTSDLKGFAKKTVGRVEEEAGKLLKDQEMELEGNKHRLDGEHAEIDAGLSDRARAEMGQSKEKPKDQG